MLLGGYFHADEFRCGKYIWPSFLVWALDRALRVGRVVFYNHLYFGFSEKAHRLDASAELLSPHFVWLHIERPPHFHWTPGQTAFQRIAAIAREMWRQEGVRSFYKGITPRVLRVAPGQAVVFAVYERVRKVMENLQGSSEDRIHSE